jgi:spore germination cell wall hydrolase CwlJ-like protein
MSIKYTIGVFCFVFTAHTGNINLLHCDMPNNVNSSFFTRLNADDQHQISCIAQNIYHESRGEPINGQIAVANVTMNRAGKESPCEVVYKKINGKCQFSWVCNKKPADNINRQIKYIAQAAYTGKLDDITDGSLYFHAVYVRPKWRKAMDKTIKIGNHIFYKPKI